MDETKERKPGHVLEHPCPECDGEMVLRTSRYGLFYGCRAYPQCRCTHGAHPNGEPLGVPADADTRLARTEAHAVFDTLWKSGRMSRGQAYRWLAGAMGLDEVHIGAMSGEACARVIRLVEEEARTVWEQ